MSVFGGGQAREPHPGGERLPIRLTDGKDAPPLREALEALGLPRDKKALARLEQVIEREEEVLEWLRADPERAARFVREPVATLGELLGVELPQVEQPIVPEHLTVVGRLAERLAGARGNTAALDALEALWRHISASEANTAAFRTDPLGTAESATASATEQGRADLLAVLRQILGIHTLETRPPAAGFVRLLAGLQERGLLRGTRDADA